VVSIKTKLNLFGILIILLTLILATISIAWVLTENNITKSKIELQDNMKMIESELEFNKKRLLSSSQKTAELQELGLKIKHISRNKNSYTRNIKPLYSELANATHDSAKIAGDIWKTMIYDYQGDLISFSHIEQDFSKKGYAFNFPNAEFMIANGKTLNNPLSNPWKKNVKSHEFNAHYKENIPNQASVIYSQNDSKLTIKSFYPITGLNFSKALGKMIPSSVGFVLTENPLDDLFIDKIKKFISNKEINIYLFDKNNIYLTTGTLKQYKILSKTYATNQKVKVEGTNYIQETLSLYNNDKLIGVIALLQIEKTIIDYVLELLKSLLVVFIIILSIVIPFTVMLIRTITTPIINLQQGIKELSSGNLGKQLDIYSKDEIGQLTMSFNDMSKELAKTDKIKILNTQLKQTSLKLEKSNKNINDSISYASLIQKAILPHSDIMNSYVDDFFVFWQPKDTVGGDIYFIIELESKEEILIMMIDGAGHGVSGAFVTMLVKAIETQIIADISNKKLQANPSDILEYFNKSIKTMLNQTKGAKSNAGFDGGILYYNKRTKECKYAGAKTDLYVVNNNHLEIVNGDMKSVGFCRTKIDQKYKQHNVLIQKDTKLYLATDGIYDQEGENKSRYGIGQFKKKIIEINKYPFDTQKEMLINDFNQFKKTIKQTDDITIIGLNFR